VFTEDRVPEALFYKEEGNTLYIRAEGHLTAALCADLRELVFSRIDAQPRVEGIKADLSGVTYMDSTFMGLLVGFTKRLSKNNATLQIFNPSKIAEELLDSLGICDLVEVSREANIFPTEMRNIVKTKQTGSDLLLKAHENLMELSEANKKKFETLHAVLKQTNQHKE
jgi:anti-sigma B factor antagonist